jgi:putative IMPACT (imprinted ancient) family translation regulator
LSRAYANTTGEVLGVALLEQRAPVVRFELEFPYHQVGAVKRLIHPPQVTLVTADYGEQVTMTVDVQTAAAEELRAALADLGVRVDHPSERGVD